MDKGEKWKDVSTRLPTLAPEIMTVGPERPCESQEEEGSGERPRIANATMHERNEQEPLEPIPENLAFRATRPRKTEEMEDGSEESRHNANEEGWETTCEEVQERVSAEGSGIGSRPGRGPDRTAFRFRWSTIQIWIGR